MSKCAFLLVCIVLSNYILCPLLSSPLLSGFTHSRFFHSRRRLKTETTGFLMYIINIHNTTCILLVSIAHHLCFLLPKIIYSSQQAVARICIGKKIGCLPLICLVDVSLLYLFNLTVGREQLVGSLKLAAVLPH